MVADLAELELIDDLAAELTSVLGGGVDVLINNAGVPKRRGVRDLTAADVEEVMRINYFSPVALTLALLPGMLERDQGDIVNVSSMGAHMVAYRVGALRGLEGGARDVHESLHVELVGTAVRAHPLFVPGTTTTQLSTPKDGNDAPFPTDPSTAPTAEQVGAELIGALGEERLITTPPLATSHVGPEASDPQTASSPTCEVFAPG